jgi:hypothetical protein
MPEAGTAVEPVELVPIEEVETELRVLRTSAEALLERLDSVENLVGEQLLNLHTDVAIVNRATERALQTLADAHQAAA